MSASAMPSYAFAWHASSKRAFWGDVRIPSRAHVLRHRRKELRRGKDCRPKDIHKGLRGLRRMGCHLHRRCQLKHAVHLVRCHAPHRASLGDSSPCDCCSQSGIATFHSPLCCGCFTADAHVPDQNQLPSLLPRQFFAVRERAWTGRLRQGVCLRSNQRGAAMLPAESPDGRLQSLPGGVVGLSRAGPRLTLCLSPLFRSGAGSLRTSRGGSWRSWQQ